MMNQILAQLDQDKGRSEPRQSHVTQGGNSASFTPIIEFSVFEGNDPRGWVKKMHKVLWLVSYSRQLKN